MEVMQPYQKDLMSKFAGYKPGEMMVVSASRQTGKSLYMQYANQWDEVFNKKPPFEILASAKVDGVKWYTVRCKSEVAKWVRTMHSSQWQEHIDSRGYINKTVFDMDSKLFTMLGMKFS